MSFQAWRGLAAGGVLAFVRALGDFGATAVRNPANNQNFPNNRIPANLISQQALRAQAAFFPLPNFGPPTLTAGNYRAQFNGPEDHRIMEARVVEQVRVRLPRPMLEEHRDGPLKLRLFGAQGHVDVELPRPYLQGFLAAVAAAQPNPS